MSDGSGRPVSPARRLREAIARPGTLEVPGVHDGFSARAAEILGFDAIHVGGMVSVGANLGVPDMGMMTTDEMIAYGAAIAAVVDIPLILDIDDGGGNPLRIRRAVQQMERAGIAGFHIEDTDFSKGKHFPPKTAGEEFDFARQRQIPIEPAGERVRAAVDARQDPDTVIIARTDAALVSVDDAIERGQLFAELGADMFFCPHMPVEETGRVIDAIPVPIMNHGMSLSGATAEERQAFMDAGLKILVTPTAAPFAAYRAAWNALETIKKTGVVPYPYEDVGAMLAQVVRYSEWGDMAYHYKMVD
jgi:2-methylisocitrate lyase-like PEP mutase family enzyme